METVGRFPCKSQFAKTHQKKKPDFVLRPAPTLTENFYQTPLVQRRPDDHHFNSYPPLFLLPPPSQQHQPPLLPLPQPYTRIQTPNPRMMMRSLSCQPSTNYRKNRNDSLITPKKHYASAANYSRQISKNLKKATEKDIDEQVTKMYNSSISGSAAGAKSVKDAKKEVVDFSGSPFTAALQVQSPPPSSLPLPTFTLRQKPQIRSF